MHCNKYNVVMDGEIIASNMELDVAMILVKGLLNEYYEQDDLKVSIEVIPPSN